MSLTTLYNSISTNFNALKDTADTALAQLNNFAQWSTPNVPYGTTSSSLYKEDKYLPIDRISSVDDMVATVQELATHLAGINYIAPSAVTNFTMLDHKTWQDNFADKIEANLSSYLDSLGIPDKSYQDAIFNEDYNRKLQTLNDLYDLADAKTGARGFTYNNDQSTALKLDAQQKYQFDLTQIGRDITKLVTEWARQNYQFAIQNGISFEQFNADFTYKYCTGFVDIYKNLVMASIEQFKAELGKYVEPIRALVEAAKLPLDAGIANAGIGEKNATIFMESNKTQIMEAVQIFDTNVKAAISIFGTQVQALAEVAKESASFIQAASQSIIGIQK